MIRIIKRVKHSRFKIHWAGVFFYMLIACTLCSQAFAQNEDSIHRVGIVDQGYEALLFRIHLINQAQTSVDVQTFIWENDECGNAFMQACVNAAKRGVRVRFLADHLYTDHSIETALSLAQVSPNLEIRRYRPHRNRLNTKTHENVTHLVTAFRAHNQRMHNKVLIVDGRIALPGGRNISNHYFDYVADRNYLDRDVLVTGPLVADLQLSFDEYWDYRRSIPQRELKDVQKGLMDSNLPIWESASNPTNDVFLKTLYADLNNSEQIEMSITKRLRKVENAWMSVDPPGKNKGFGFFGLQSGSQSAKDLFHIMKDADETVLIQSPYMVMGAGTKRLFRKLRDRTSQVKVDLITNSYASTGNMPAYAGAFRTRPNALRLGINVYEMKPIPEDLGVFMAQLGNQMDNFDKYSVHAKSMVVDGGTSYIGSFNLDPRSIHLNTELGIVVEDEAFAHELTESIQRSLLPGNSWRIQSRDIPLAYVNQKIEWTSQHLPLDVWPIASTAVFEGDSELGVLPVDDKTSMKRWMFRFHRSIGFLTRPLL